MRVIDGRYSLKKIQRRDDAGVLYRAWDLEKKAPVMLRIIEGPGTCSPGLCHRDFREFRAMGRLEHPGLVKLLGFSIDPVFYYTTEPFEGKDIRAFFRPADSYGSLTDPNRIQAIVAAAIQILDALQCLHDHQILCRRLSPLNLWMETCEGEVRARLSDLGFTRWFAERELQFIQDGRMLPLYAAPERSTASAVDARSDLYSMGVILFELLTLRPPFIGRNALGVISQHLYEDPPAIRALNPAVHPVLEDAVHQLLNKDPNNRFQSAAECIDRLRELRRDEPRTARGLLHLQRSKLVGRRAELSVLMEKVKRLQDGYPSVTFLKGESGSGKTRLLDEVLLRVRLKDMNVLHGRAVRDGKGYCTLFTQVLDQCAEIILGRSLTEAGKLLPANARMLLKFSQKFEEVPSLAASATPGQVPPDEDRLRSFKAVADLIRNLAMEKPILFLLDDVHWADPISLALLAFLSRGVASPASGEVIPVGFQCCWTTDSAAVPSVIEPLEKEKIAHTLTLSPLTRAEIAELLRGLLGHDTTSEERLAWVEAETGGNPLCIEEIAREIPAAQPAAGDPWVRGPVEPPQPADAVSVEPPPGLHEGMKVRFLRRIEALSKPARKCLKVGAVIGQDFSFDLVHDVLGLPEEDLMDAITELLHEKILVETPGGADTYAFYHDRLRDVVLSGMTETKQKHLHSAVGDGMERIHGSRLSSIYVDLAEHFDRAGRWDKALCYLPLVAARFKLRFETRAALQYYERFLELYAALDDKLKAETAGVLLNVLLDMGDIYEACGEDASARVVFERAVGFVAAMNDDRLKADCDNRLARALLKTGDGERSMALCRAAYQRATGAGHRRGSAEAEMTLGAVYFQRGDLDQALKWRKTSLAHCRDLNFTWGISTNLQAIGAIRARQARWKEARDARLEGLEYARASGDRNRISQLATMVGRTYVMLRDTGTARAFLEEGRSTAERIGNLRTAILAHENLAMAADFHNDFPGMETHLLRAGSLANTLEDAPTLLRVNLNLANLFVQIGMLKEARTWLSGLAVSAAWPRELCFFRSVTAAQLHAAEGKPGAGLSVLEEGLRLIPDNQDRFGLFEGLVTAAGLARAVGDGDRFGRLLSRASTLRGDGVMPEFEGRFLVLSASLLNPDASYERLMQALSMAEELRIPRLASMADFEMSRLCDRWDRFEQASVHLRRAAAAVATLAATLGARRDLYLRLPEPAAIAAVEAAVSSGLPEAAGLAAAQR